MNLNFNLLKLFRIVKVLFLKLETWRDQLHLTGCYESIWFLKLNLTKLSIFSTINPTRRRQDSFRNPSGAREPIRKSPREFIIPITLEGGGCITPLTPMTPMTPMTPKSPVTPGTPMTPSEDGIRPTASANVRQKSNRPDRSRRHGWFYPSIC